MRLLLDSAFIIDQLRAEPGAVARWARIFEEGDEPLLNEVVVCEVRAGLRPADEPELRAVLEPMEFLQPDPEDAMTAGRWRAEAHARGRHLGLADALIAAAARANDAAVLTRNVRDFALTPVRVETY